MRLEESVLLRRMASAVWGNDSAQDPGSRPFGSLPRATNFSLSSCVSSLLCPRSAGSQDQKREILLDPQGPLLSGQNLEVRCDITATTGAIFNAVMSFAKLGELTYFGLAYMKGPSAAPGVRHAGPPSSSGQGTACRGHDLGTCARGVIVYEVKDGSRIATLRFQ
uniref:FERM N-terminal domain-containing protein n=1 Tax=Molossus molossus TaxID=27622 RepID=A0A7J8DP77_MOLMO|nr:hypothetical protein HJG59_005321 [Molossus molossus]